MIASLLHQRWLHRLSIGLCVAISLMFASTVRAVATPSIVVNRAVINGDDLTISYTVFVERVAGDTNKYAVGFAVTADGRTVKTNAIPITPTVAPQERRVSIALATVPTDSAPETVKIDTASIIRNPGKAGQLIASQNDITVKIEQSTQLFDPDLGYEKVRSSLPPLRQNFITVLFDFLDKVFWPLFILFAIVFSGIMYIMARGDEEKAKRAKNYLVAAVSVIVIFILGYFLLDQFSLLIHYIVEGGG